MAPDPDAFALLARLTEVLLRWSYAGTAGAERIVTGVGARYGRSADVMFGVGMLIGAVAVRRPLSAGT